MKKVLIITYYWPPAGGIGVLRCLKFAKYLRHFGWEPVIYTAENPHYHVIDESNSKDVHPDQRMIYGKIWEPHALFKKFAGHKKDENINSILYLDDMNRDWKTKFGVWIRSNYFIPDARKFWIKPSVKKLVNLLENEHFDAILTDGPPHTNTRIATLLKKKTGVPWLMDFQDPWTQVDYYQNLLLSESARKKHEKMEQEAVETASAISIVSPSWKKDLESINAFDAHVLYWGFDEDDYLSLNDQKHERFSITHIGLLGPDRIPYKLLEVVSELNSKISNIKDKIQLRFIGKNDKGLIDEVTKLRMSDDVLFIEDIPRMEAIQQLKSSHISLLLINKRSNAEGRIPGKLFECLAVRNPILSLGPEVSNVKDIIIDADAGLHTNYTDISNITKYINKHHQFYLNNEKVSLNNNNLSKYTNKEITRKLAKILESISV